MGVPVDVNEQALGRLHRSTDNMSTDGQQEFRIPIQRIE
jgi:hypothetical protein